MSVYQHEARPCRVIQGPGTGAFGSRRIQVTRRIVQTTRSTLWRRLNSSWCTHGVFVVRVSCFRRGCARRRCSPFGDIAIQLYGRWYAGWSRPLDGDLRFRLSRLDHLLHGWHFQLRVTRACLGLLVGLSTGSGLHAARRLCCTWLCPRRVVLLPSRRWGFLIITVHGDLSIKPRT